MGPDGVSLITQKEVCVELVRINWYIFVNNVDLLDGVIITDGNLFWRCISRYWDEDVTLDTTQWFGRSWFQSFVDWSKSTRRFFAEGLDRINSETWVW